MKMRFIVFIALFLLTVTLITAGVEYVTSKPAPAAVCDHYCQEVKSQPPWPGLRCTEDMPCWNCHTMGNKICGPGHENDPINTDQRWEAAP